jgi:DNA-binding FadR family transcriptional regulator
MRGMHDHVLEPMQRMPMIEEMTGRLRELIDSGRSTTREALRTLEAIGLIERSKGPGAFVQAKDSAADEEFPFADWRPSYGRRIADLPTYDAIAAGDAEQAAERMESHLLEFARELGVKASAPMAREKAR